MWLIVFSVLSINIIDTRAEKMVDVVFPDKSQGVAPVSWSSGDSIKLTGDTIKQCGGINGEWK